MSILKQAGLYQWMQKTALCCCLGVLDAPEAKEIPHTVTAPHGAQRQDPYYWLRDDERVKPEMLEYLKAS